ncbi:MAG: pitrilysin family protein [Candidatus Kapabacteria bacterium]|nr:pitrilysin family protein [Candidatus Kapabacteria bacterium]
MNKLILVIVSLLISLNLSAQDINPDVKPQPLASTGFVFPNYTVQTLSNGLKVYIIEDKEQPTVAFRLMVFGGSSVEGQKAGLAELMSGMMTKGTKTRTASKIASSMDGIGATLTSNAGNDYFTVYAEGLKKYQSLILETMSDIALNPIFPVDEFAKLQQQTIAGIEYEKSSPGTLAQALSRIAVYGVEHPYAQRKTEKSVNSITVDDLKNFHSSWTKPGNASLAVVGDVNPNTIVKELEKYFKNWKKGEVKRIVIPEASPMPKGVYLVKRPGSVQTSVIITTNTIPYNDIDYDRLNLATQLIGGANGRIYQTLREKYSFTYSPYGFLTTTKYANRFAAVAEVAAEKTDSSIAVINNELRDIIRKSPDAEELNRVRTSYLGNYFMSFENSLFVASLIQNEDFYGKKINDLKNYAKRIESYVPSDITAAVSSYINPENAQIVVVGDPSIVSSIEKYGQIFEYDLDLNPLSGVDAKLEPVSISPEMLIEKYENAIGGKLNIEKIKTLNAVSTAVLTASGKDIPGKVLSQKKVPNKLYNLSDFGIFASQVWVDGVNAWSGQPNQPSTLQDGESKARMMFEAEMFSVLALKKHNYKTNVLGKIQKRILMSAVNPAGNEIVYYFNSDSYLLELTELKLDGPDGVKQIWSIISDDYNDYGGVLLPKLQKTITPGFSITLKTSYEINKEIDDAVFKPQM